jgi:hypothetical protein
MNPLFMDPYRSAVVDGFPTSRDPASDARQQNDPSSGEWWPIRKSLGYARWFASRLDLKLMRPRPELSSTGYCVADPERDYLIYLPPLEARRDKVLGLFGLWPGRIQVDLTAAKGSFSTEWFDPSTASIVAAQPVTGGSKASLSSPFGSRGAVLRIVPRGSGSPST